MRPLGRIFPSQDRSYQGPYACPGLGTTRAAAPASRSQPATGAYQERLTDPDTGTTTSTFDDDSEVLSTTDQDQHELSYDYDPLGRKLDEYKGTTSGTRIASWGYDPTSAKGYPASSTAYDENSATETYSSTVAGYTTDYQPTGTTVTIPSGAYSNTSDITYSTVDTYTPIQDQLLTSQISTTGAGSLMPNETLTYGYDDPGNPVTLGGADKYTAWIDYTPLGQTLRATMGDTADQVVATGSWEQATGRLLNYSLDKEDGTSAVDSIDYTYDQSGRLTSTKDTQDAGGTANTDLQCYRYDYLSRLTDIWTDSGGTTTQPSPSINGIGTCTNTSPDPSNINGAGPAPYWQSYGYGTDLTGNRLSKTDHSLTPGVTPDVTTNEVYDTPGHTHAVHTVTTGDTTQTYTYDGEGNPKGITTTQNGTDQPDQDQTLTWNATGQLNTLSIGSHSSSYGYDPDGNLVARTDDGTTTLFLGGDQITLGSNGNTTSVARYYSLPGTPTVVRTATSGQTGTTLDYQSADPQGTATTDITADDLTVTHREYTPFGETRGTTPTNWPGDKGFVGGTVNDNTGLTNLGAREYNPSLGRFINPDPLLDPKDPQQWNGYAYSNNDPVNASDPTGQLMFIGGDGCVGSEQAVATCTDNQAKAAKDTCDYQCEVKGYHAIQAQRVEDLERAVAHPAAGPLIPSIDDPTPQLRRIKYSAPKFPPHCDADCKKTIRGWLAGDSGSPDYTPASKGGCGDDGFCEEMHFLKRTLAWPARHIYVSGSLCVHACVNLGYQDLNLSLNFSGGLSTAAPTSLSRLVKEYGGVLIGISTATPDQEKDQLLSVSAANRYGGNGGFGLRSGGHGFYYFGGATIGVGAAIQGPGLSGVNLNFRNGDLTWTP